MDHAAHAIEPTVRPRTVVIGQERTGSLKGEDLEVKAEVVPRNTEERMMDLLTGLAKRVAKAEVSQGAKDQPMDKGYSFFGSAVGPGKPMNRRALD